MNSISQKAKEIFVSVVDDAPPEEWDHRVDEACQGDDELRRRVHSLLLAHAQPDSRLEHVAIDFPLTLDRPPLEQPGTQIGPYKLLQQIGEGGMGAVYMAEQKQPVKRRVALKIIKPGMDTRQVIARFEAERQALAMMDHPNIAKVLDAGATASGRPYFVMELVNGLPVTRFCDEKHLTPKERLELFVPICQAVQHAHQKGIIHRDLKPSNILVALFDGNPVPKIIDFGVAKATSQTLTEKTMFTQLGQVVGTLEYMSPEQAERNQLDVDTRSDIYSLGVVLYELLAGDTPFDRSRLRSVAFEEMLRIIREEEPPRPSTKLSSSHSLPSIAANRRIEPAKLGSLIRGELDWIALKAMEKDRGRRYETASKFAEDVQHFLNDEPVVACPASTVYRFRKFVRRNEGTLVISGMMAAALLMVVGSLGWALRDRSARQAKFVLERQEREAELAQQSEVRLIRTRTRVEALLSEIDRLAEEQRWDEALAVAKRAEVAIASDMAEEAVNEKVRSLLRQLEFVARLTQIRMNRAMIAGNAFDHAGAAENYAQAFRDFGVDVDVLTADDAVARLKRHLRIILPVAAALDDFVYVRRRIEKSSGLEVDSTVLIETARRLNPDPLRNQLRIMWGREATPELQATLRQLVDSFDVRMQGPLTAERLAYTLKDAELPDLAEHILREAQQHFPGDFWLNHSLGSVLLERSEHLEAVRFYTAALGIKPESPAAQMNLGVALCKQGKRDEGIACFFKAIELDSNYPKSYHNLGSALTEQGKLEEAITCFQKAIKLEPKMAVAHYSLGLTLEKQEKLDDAIACYRKAIECDPKNALVHNNIGIALDRQGKLDDAIPHFHKAIELDPKLAVAHFNLGLVHAKQGKLDDAIRYNHQAIDVDPNLAIAYYNLGLAHAKQGKLDDAIPCLRKAIELDPNSAMAHDLLGTLLMDLGSPEEAVSSLRKAIEVEPNHVNAHLHLGLVLARNGQIEEAITALRKSIDLDPNSAPAHNDAAWLLATANDVRMRNPQEAIGLARQAVQLDPKSWPHWNTLSVAAWRAGEWQESLRAREEAIRLNNKGSAMCWNNLGMAMLRWHLGQNEEALNGYDQVREQIIKLAADNPGLQGFWEEAKALLGIPSETPNAEVEQ